MMLEQHKKFVRCNVHLEVLSGAKADLALTVPSQVLKLKSYISGRSEVRAAARVPTDEMVYFWLRRQPLYGKYPL